MATTGDKSALLNGDRRQPRCLQNPGGWGRLLLAGGSSGCTHEEEGGSEVGEGDSELTTSVSFLIYRGRRGLDGRFSCHSLRTPSSKDGGKGTPPITRRSMCGVIGFSDTSHRFPLTACQEKRVWSWDASSRLFTLVDGCGIVKSGVAKQLNRMCIHCDVHLSLWRMDRSQLQRRCGSSGSVWF